MTHLPVVTLFFVLVGCGSSNESSMPLSSDSSMVWDDMSATGALYILDPGQFDSDSQSPPAPDITFDTLTITSELKSLLSGIAPQPIGDGIGNGVFPACTPEPGLKLFYLVVTDKEGAEFRYPHQNGCAIGYGLYDNTGYFEQDIAGVVTTEDMCLLGSNFGVATSDCQ